MVKRKLSFKRAKEKKPFKSGGEFARVAVGAILGLALLQTIGTSLKK